MKMNTENRKTIFAAICVMVAIILLALPVAMTSMNVFDSAAEEVGKQFTDGDDEDWVLRYEVLSENTVSVIECYYDAYGPVEIPDNIEHGGITYDVVSIDDEAFSGCADLTSIKIPDSVISIG